ncbi:glycosyltransferase family 4 protein [Patescibacteria group bacterium]|nr:glycosyltransferase family 4 protein [Patescibacteria group bacterium]
MNKINVLLDTSPLHSGSHIRGIGTYTRLLKQELEKREDLNVVPVENREDVRHFHKNIQQYDAKSTLIHYPFFDLFFSTLPLFRKFKTVVTVHDVIPLKFPEHYKPGRKGKLRFYKQAFALQSVEAVITDSQASRQDIIKYLKVKPSLVHPIYLAAPPGILAQSEKMQDTVRQKLGLPAQYVLYVGDINYNKNIPQLVKMLKYLPEDIHLVCVGKNFTEQDIPEWRWIEAQVALSDVPNRVQFITNLGVDALDSLAAIYSGAVAYIQPSLYEGFGLPVLEAMQAKVPVIASKNSSLIEVGGEHAQLVLPEAEAFADAVLTVLKWSKTHRQEVIKAAYTWSQQFSWTKVAEETVAVYKKVLNLS